MTWKALGTLERFTILGRRIRETVVSLLANEQTFDPTHGAPGSRPPGFRRRLLDWFNGRLLGNASSAGEQEQKHADGLAQRPEWLSHPELEVAAKTFAYILMALLVVAVIWGVYYLFLHFFPS